MDAREVARLIEPIKKRAQLAISRAVLNLVADDKELQRGQVEALAGDVRDDVERFQNYGFTSVPLSGSECIVAAVGGTSSHTVILVCDDRRFRLQSLAAGEVAIYDNKEQIVHLMKDKIKIFTKNPITVDASDITVTGKGNTTINVEGNVSIVAEGVSRIQGKEVQIVGTTSLKLDAGGYGETWTVGGRTTWTQGTSTTNAGSPSPPEHP